MKLKSGLTLRQIAGENVVLASGADTELKGMITLNETACLLWRCLEKGAEVADLADALLAEYEDVDPATAAAHAEAFAAKMKELDLLV
ncbi:MAG: PqqD family protein [Oscillospiraceae bacterium]|nr:PqqD family protein [Oscillospiraceae bacterium]